MSDYVYVTSYSEDAVAIIDVTDPVNPSFVSSAVNGSGFSLSGPYGICISGDYIFVATWYSVDGIQAIDVSNPLIPVSADFARDGVVVEAGYLSNNVPVFRKDNYVFVGAGGGALTVLDITDPSNIVSAGAISDSSFNGPYGLYVGETYAYVVNYYNNNFVVFDVSDVGNIVSAGILNNGAGGALLYRPTDVFVSGNYAYVAHGSTNYDDNGVEIIDISTPSAPVSVASITNGPSGYNGFWDPYGLYIQGNYLFIAGWNGVEIVDITDPTTPTHSGNILYSDIEFCNHVIVDGNYAYAVFGDGALEVIDVSDKSNPTSAGRVLDGDNGALLDGAWGITKILLGFPHSLTPGFSVTPTVGFKPLNISVTDQSQYAQSVYYDMGD